MLEMAAEWHNCEEEYRTVTRSPGTVGPAKLAAVTLAYAVYLQARRPRHDAMMPRYDATPLTHAVL